MGSSCSKKALVAFEVINESYTGIAAGFLGVLVLLTSGNVCNKLVPALLICSLTLASVMYLLNDAEAIETCADKVVLITGCDTGLGYSLALHACDLGFTVFAGCLSNDSPGAVALKAHSERIQVMQLDVTDKKKIEAVLKKVGKFLAENRSLVLWAVINNAGVMTFAEFEWLTPELIEQQIHVNLYGTFLFTKYCCPLLREYKGRIITITSHCAQAVLPGLSVYGATKTGLAAWTDGLRVEMKKYEVQVVTLIPGSFANQSNIMSKQVDKVYEMQKNFTEEQKDFYGDYFKRYTAYLTGISGPDALKKIEDKGLYCQFESALKHVNPRTKYVNECFRYKVYHWMFAYSPVWLRDRMMLRFMKMPAYCPKTKLIPDIIA